MGNKTRAAILVSIVTLFQIFSYIKGFNKTYPRAHTIALIIGWAFTMPFILKHNKDMTSPSFQIFVIILILILDWFSFREDKSRLSEEEKCLFGNCRENARITGHLAHVADVISVALILWPFTQTTNIRIIIGISLFIYMIIGIIVIENYTKEGSVSDLRGKTEEEKCKQSRIMTDGWRGALNGLITVLGILAAWQSIFNYNIPPSSSSFGFPLNQLSYLFNVIFNSQGIVFLAMLAKVVIIDLGLLFIPTYANYINTAAQHGQIGAEEYGLPPCFEG